MLFDWPKKPNPLPEDETISPFRVRKCPSCGHQARGRMTNIYRGSLALTILILAPFLWVLPWMAHSPYKRWNKEDVIFILLMAVIALIQSRNGYRCANCGGILW